MPLCLSGLIASPAVASPQGAEFAAIEDTHIKITNPDDNYGESSSLMADNDTSKRILIGFQVIGIPEGASVRSATLRLFVVDPAPEAGDVRAVDGDWSEDTATWSNAPLIGNEVANLSSPATVGTWVEADVTQAIVGSGEVDFYVVTSSDHRVEYSSTEAGSSPPTLTVLWSEQVLSPTPTPMPTPTPASTPTPTSTPNPISTPTPASTPTPTSTPNSISTPNPPSKLDSTSTLSPISRLNPPSTAAAVVSLGSVGAAEDTINDEPPSQPAAVAQPPTPVASSAVQAATTSVEAATSASAAGEAPAPSQPESEPAPATPPASKASSGGFNVLPWLVGIVGVIVVTIFHQSVRRS